MDLITTGYDVWSQTDGLELILAAVAGLFAWLLIKRCLRVLFSARARRHRRKRRQADRVLRTINSFGPGPAMGYLRKIDPFVFELVVLAAFKAVGCKVIYNKRFTGDGGIDGQVNIGQHWYLIQAKRYGTAINPAHVTEFAKVCSARRRKGLFVHTGRSGPMSKAAVSGTDNQLTMISGSSLLDLIQKGSLPRQWQSR